MKTGCLMAALGLAMVGGVMGEDDDWRTAFEAKVLEKGERKLPYRIATLGEGEKLPLVVFLHGAGERGDDNEAQLKHGMKDMVGWCRKEKEACRIFAPQCAGDGWWSNLEGNFRGKEPLTLKAEPGWCMAMVFEVIDELVKEGKADPDRIYITGLSMGGFGTLDAISRRPEFFAVAMPICGGGDPKQAVKYKDVPLWVFHGGKDKTVPTALSEAIVAAVKEAGGDPQFRVYPEAGHDSWSATYSDPKVLKWLFAQKKSGE